MLNPLGHTSQGPVFIFIDAATLLSNYQHLQLTSEAGALTQVDALLGLGFLQDLRVRAWDGPFGDVGVEWGETGIEGSREWVEVEKERCTGHLHQSFLNHTTRSLWELGMKDLG